MSFEHKAVVVATTSLMSRAAEMIITVTSRGGAVVVLHGGVVDAAGITLELQERGCDSLLRSGSVDFVHRSGGLVALDTAGVGVGSYSDQEPHLIVLHPLNRPVSSEHDLCGLPTDSPERSCLWSSHVCVFGSDYAATAGLTAVVGHLMVDMDGIEITLSNAEGRMLALDLLLDLLDDPAVVHQLAASPIMEKLERPALQRLVRRRLAALSASTTSSAPRRTTKSADFDSIQDAILRTDGQLDEMLEAGSPWLGSQVLVEDVHLRAVA